MALVVSVVLVIAAFVFLLVWLVHTAVDYERFGLSPFYLRDLFLRRAIRNKRLWPSPKAYGYSLIHKDESGSVWELPRSVMTRISGRDFPRSSRLVAAKQRIVQVKDSTTGKDYYLAVPMIEQTSFGKGAVAWTFGLTPEAYQLTQET